MQISIIVPFYNGNQYLNRLFKSIEAVVLETKSVVSFEVLIVNDSPDVDVILPKTTLDIRIIFNYQNMGIQGSRVNGLKHATGDWILFLDQDDELRPEGFLNQIEMTKIGDVVVGNGIYNLGNVSKKIFPNLKSMKYLIQEDRFLAIRNLIPSPGECLIKRDKIPRTWSENILKINGADDWFLWLLLFKEESKFVSNSKNVYIHNDANGENLSADLEKMCDSAKEMADILEQKKILTPKELKKLMNAIEFKYYQDTKQLSLFKIMRYISTIVANVKYKVLLIIYAKIL